jgi:hypothetical protein
MKHVRGGVRIPILAAIVRRAGGAGSRNLVRGVWKWGVWRVLRVVRLRGRCHHDLDHRGLFPMLGNLKNGGVHHL